MQDAIRDHARSYHLHRLATELDTQGIHASVKTSYPAALHVFIPGAAMLAESIDCVPWTGVDGRLCWYYRWSWGEVLHDTADPPGAAAKIAEVLAARLRPEGRRSVEELGTVAALRRYPVKSMLGEDLTEAVLTASGVAGDRVLAVMDLADGRVASAKRPVLWRGLLQCAATWHGGSACITLPDGAAIGSSDPDADSVLSGALGRPVHLSGTRPDGATLARPAPEDVLDHGDDVEVPFELLEIGQGTAGSTFVDYAPVHLITSATLDHLGTEHIRYRPNLVITTPAGQPFAENEWVGRQITVGAVRLRGILPTPRCAIPTLAHGDLPRAPRALRTLLAQNRIDVPGFGILPCAGLYAEVLDGGTIRDGDRVRLDAI